MKKMKILMKMKNILKIVKIKINGFYNNDNDDDIYNDEDGYGNGGGNFVNSRHNDNNN